MKNKYRILKIFITLIILLFTLNFSLNRFKEQEISDKKMVIDFKNQNDGLYFLRENEIKNMVKNTLSEKKIGDLDIPLLEKKIRSIPVVDSANIYLYLNGKLHIDIIQKTPVFRVNNPNEKFYVDKNANTFPLSKNYAFPCIIITGKIKKEEFPKLIQLVNHINSDDFTQKYFIGISKIKNNYFLLTTDGHFQVEIGDLNDIEFKLKGFKTFVEKFLVYQKPEKYNKISIKYKNQIVTTLNPLHKENAPLLAKKPEKPSVPTPNPPKPSPTPVKKSPPPIQKNNPAPKIAEKKNQEKKTPPKTTPPKKN